MKELMIEVKSIDKSFFEKKVLNDLSLEFYSDSIYGIVGNNGVGKSTLLNCISKVELVDSGEIYIDGENIRNCDRNIYYNIGVQFQSLYYQDRIKVKEYCELFSAIYDKIFSPLDFDILDFDEVGEQYVKDLSGGEKQLLGFITTMIGKPRILLLDEPTVGMDVKHRKKCIDYLLRYKVENKCTILYVSHSYEDILTLSDNIVVMEQDHVVSQYDLSQYSQSEKSKFIKQVYFSDNQFK